MRNTCLNVLLERLPFSEDFFSMWSSKGQGLSKVFAKQRNVILRVVLGVIPTGMIHEAHGAINAAIGIVLVVNESALHGFTR